MKKKIGLLISSMNSGGAERVVSHLSHILNDVYDVSVILFEDTYMEYECGGQICNLNVPARSGSAFTKIHLLKQRIHRLKALIKKERLSCVISFLDSPNFVNLLSSVRGCRRIISIRNYSGLENRQSRLGRLTDRFMKLLYRRADRVVTVSDLIRLDFQANYGIPADKLKTIYNPYNFAEIHDNCEQALSETEAAFYRERFVFATVGRIMYQKGIWHLLKAFSLVCRSAPDARLVLVGEDLSNGRVQALISALNLNDNVLLVGRTRNPHKYLAHTDVYVLASLFEGFPNAMVEAMVCGCPIVAADCKSGPREILCSNADLERLITTVEETDYGVLVPALESEENWAADYITDGERTLAEAMLTLYRSEEKRKQYSALSRKRSAAFSYDNCKQQFQSVIED